MRIKIRYVNIDNFNRPIFRELSNKNYYGSCDILFPYETSEEEVLKKVSEKDLVYFGNSFNCEPMGTTVNNLEIIPRYRENAAIEILQNSHWLASDIYKAFNSAEVAKEAFQKREEAAKILIRHGWSYRHISQLLN